MRRNFLFVHFTTQLKNFPLLVALVTQGLMSFKIFKCPVNRYTRTNLIWKSSIKDFCFGSSSVHHATPFSTREVSFLYLSCFRNIQQVKTTLAPEDEYCFFIAAPASYHNNNGYCLNQCESEVCYSVSNHIVLMGHRGRQLNDDLTCFVL